MLQCDGYVGMAIVQVENIHQDSIPVPFPVNNDSFQVHQPVLYVVIEHHYGKQIVGAAAKVGIENYCNRLSERMGSAVTNVLCPPGHKA